jgi:hypothetical protein
MRSRSHRRVDESLYYSRLFLRKVNLLFCASPVLVSGLQPLHTMEWVYSPLANAVARNSAIFQLSRVIGQAASGALVATIRAGGAMLLSAATYLAPIASVTRIRVGNVGRSVERAPLGVALSQGITTLWKRSALLAPSA